MPYKVKRPPKSYDIEVLSLAVAALGKEVGELEATNTQLSFRHSILHATCEILEMVGAIKQTGQPGSAEAELLAQLQEIGASLAPRRTPDCPLGCTNQPQQEYTQPQLRSTGSSSSSSLCGSNAISSDARNLLDLGEHETIGTLRDPLRALRLSMQTQTPVDAVDSMTLQDLQQDYQETVNQLALNMAFLDNPFRRSQTGDSNPFEKIKKLLARHGQLLTSLLVGGKANLIPQFMMSDVATGEQKEDHSEELYEYAVQRLGLSQEQKLRVQATLNCFQGLLSSIVEERTLLQQQLGLPPGFGLALPQPDGSRSSSDGSSTGSSESSGMLQAAAAAAAVRGRDRSDPVAAKASKAALNQHQQAVRQQHHEQQHKLAQIVKLLKKESLLKSCTWVGIEGCLTWVQLAKLATCCYPHPASPIAFAQAVDRHLQQRQQAQQQEQHVQQQQLQLMT